MNQNKLSKKNDTGIKNMQEKYKANTAGRFSQIQLCAGSN